MNIDNCPVNVRKRPIRLGFSKNQAFKQCGPQLENLSNTGGTKMCQDREGQGGGGQEGGGQKGGGQQGGGQQGGGQQGGGQQGGKQGGGQQGGQQGGGQQG